MLTGPLVRARRAGQVSATVRSRSAPEVADAFQPFTRRRLRGLLIHVAKHVSARRIGFPLRLGIGSDDGGDDVLERLVAAVANATMYLHGTIGRFKQTVGPVVTLKPCLTG